MEHCGTPARPGFRCAQHWALTYIGGLGDGCPRTVGPRAFEWRGYSLAKEPGGVKKHAPLCRVRHPHPILLPGGEGVRRVRTLTLILSQRERHRGKNKLLYIKGWSGGVLFEKGEKTGGPKNSQNFWRVRLLLGGGLLSSRAVPARSLKGAIASAVRHGSRQARGQAAEGLTTEHTEYTERARPRMQPHRSHRPQRKTEEKILNRRSRRALR